MVLLDGAHGRRFAEVRGGPVWKALSEINRLHLCCQGGKFLPHSWFLCGERGHRKSLPAFLFLKKCAIYDMTTRPRVLRLATRSTTPVLSTGPHLKAFEAVGRAEVEVFRAHLPVVNVMYSRY